MGWGMAGRVTAAGAGKDGRAGSGDSAVRSAERESDLRIWGHWYSMLGGKLKAGKHALWAALCSAACGGALRFALLRRCEAPSAVHPGRR